MTLGHQLLETIGIVKPGRAAYRPMFHRLALALIVQIYVQNTGAATVLPDFRRSILTLKSRLTQNLPDLSRRQTLQPGRFVNGQAAQRRVATL